MTGNFSGEILVQDFDGARHPFDAQELQTRLISCFIASGRGDEGFVAEDIALALEYTLRRAPRPEPVFGRGEIDAAVVRLLEEAGFPETAKLFRQHGGGEKIIEISTDPASVGELLAGFLACPPERFDRVVALVSEAAAKLTINPAPPKLLLELARHYERILSAAAERTDFPPTPPLTMSRREMFSLLPPEARNMIDEGILRISAITPLFARIHFFFTLGAFARHYELSVPLTELEAFPLFYRAGRIMGEARRAIIRALPPDTPELPCLLTLPDIFDFLDDYVGPGESNGAFAAEIAGALTAEIGCELYKLNSS